MRFIYGYALTVYSHIRRHRSHKYPIDPEDHTSGRPVCIRSVAAAQIVHRKPSPAFCDGFPDYLVGHRRIDQAVLIMHRPKKTMK